MFQGSANTRGSRASAATAQGREYASTSAAAAAAKTAVVRASVNTDSRRIAVKSAKVLASALMAGVESSARTAVFPLLPSHFRICVRVQDV